MPKSRIPPIPKWIPISFAIGFGVFIVVYIGVGWYFSGKLFELKPQKVAYDQTVRAVQDEDYTIQGTAYDIDGVVGAIRQDGTPISTMGAPKNLNETDKVSTRTSGAINGVAPKVGEKISLQGNMWTTDPKQALGVDFKEIKYHSPAGDMQAWLIPGQSNTTWTIAVHGIGAHRNEMLRFVKPVLAAGDTMMVMSYRGDTGNPPTADGRNHFGDIEWQDLEAAVRYAKEHGATEIQLYGTSLGGSIIQNYLRRSPDVKTTNISKVVLDSPALDWNAILRYRVKKMGYPAFIAKPGMDMARVRAGINFKRITTQPGSITHKTLIIHNADDKSVPQAPSKKVAATQPDMVTFVDFGSGGHIRAWNHDPQRYETLVTNFLKQ